jgi:hypothetical protein
MNMTASERFEDRLLEQLRQVAAERPAPSAPSLRRPRRARLALAGGAVTAAVAAAAIVASSGGVTSSAYALQSEPNGAVTVHILSLKDAGGLESSLRAAGIPAVVDYVPPGQAGCIGPPPAGTGAPAHGTLQRVEPGGKGDAGPSLSTQGSAPGAGSGFSATGKPGGGAPAPKMGSKVSVGSDGASFTVDPGSIPPGEKLYITTSTGTVSTIGMAISKDNPASDCAAPNPAP